MDTFIQIEKLSKRFDGPPVVDDLSFTIGQGELFAILGGSGCGKTTLLRMMAGFEKASSGRIVIDGVDVTQMPAYERPVNMMFQSYAVFPHMTVERNVAYGLVKEGVGKSEINSRVGQMLEMVQLTGYEKRRSSQLSGGQLQRVALARALVKRPKVLLLDEPMAALDKQLRVQMQFELMNIQDELGVTFVVVTHDQEEAMSLATRIAVMDQGRFLQTGTPGEVYEFPQNMFVAGFFGAINGFDGKVVDVKGRATVVETVLGRISARADGNITVGQSVTVAVRPEKVSIGASPPGGDLMNVLGGRVVDLGYFGNHSIYRVQCESGEQVQVSTLNQHRAAEHQLQWEDEAYVWWSEESTIVLAE